MTIGPKLVEKMKTEILGRDYDLSFSFISKNEIKNLNRVYRSKDAPTDILSFPLEKNSGEIVICKQIAKLKSVNFNYSIRKYLCLLVIHGLLHLKGLSHGAKMEQLELEYLSKFYERSHNSRN